MTGRGRAAGLRLPGTLALGAGTLVAAGLFDAEPLLVAGFGLLALGLASGLTVALAGRGAQVTREIPCRRVAEEELVSVRLRARAPWPFPGGELTEPLLGEPFALPFGRRSAALRIDVRFARRGLRELEPAQLMVGDPLGIARRRAAVGQPDRVLVLPRVEPVRRPELGGERPWGRRDRPAPGGDGVDPDGLRPYRPGAPAARIHWPALARGAGLLERRLSAEADARPVVVLDAGGAPAQEDLDAAVRACASLCRELAGRGGCGVLLPGERRLRSVGPDLGAWPGVWAALAMVEPGRGPALTAALARAAAVVYVTARTPARLPAALPGSPARHLLVAPARVAVARDARAVLEVAGCRGYVLRARVRAQEVAA